LAIRREKKRQSQRINIASEVQLKNGIKGIKCFQRDENEACVLLRKRNKPRKEFQRWEERHVQDLQKVRGIVWKQKSHYCHIGQP